MSPIPRLGHAYRRDQRTDGATIGQLQDQAESTQLKVVPSHIKYLELVEALDVLQGLGGQFLANFRRPDVLHFVAAIGCRKQAKLDSVQDAMARSVRRTVESLPS